MFYFDAMQQVFFIYYQLAECFKGLHRVNFISETFLMNQKIIPREHVMDMGVYSELPQGMAWIKQESTVFVQSK